MRLVDFLIHLLDAHAQTLQRLAALFGEEVLLEMLETAGESPSTEGEETPALPRLESPWLDPPSFDASYSPYAELEAAVHDMKLPAVFEFHLWAYPPYRAYIESPLDLNSKIRGPGGDVGTVLVDEAVAQAEAWIKKLPIPPEHGLQAERAAHIPWLRFRAEVLKRIGRRPLGPVY